MQDFWPVTLYVGNPFETHRSSVWYKEGYTSYIHPHSVMMDLDSLLYCLQHANASFL